MSAFTEKLVAALAGLNHRDPKQWEADGTPNLAHLSTVVEQAVTAADVAKANGGEMYRREDVPYDETLRAKPLAPMAPKSDDDEDSKPDPAQTGAASVEVQRRAYTLDDAAVDQEALAALDGEWQDAMTAADVAKTKLDAVNKKRDTLITRINSLGPVRDGGLHDVVKKIQAQSMAENEARAEVNAKLRGLTGGVLPTPHASPLDARMAARKGIRRQAGRMGMA